MRSIRVPDVGLRRALQPADIEKHTPLFAALQREWQHHIATLHLPGACTGTFALCAAIKVHTVPAGLGSKLKSFAIMTLRGLGPRARRARTAAPRPPRR